ncbi:MAG: T9SS type A sorting domain-containing protein, partial [Bacteroidota bacterium]
QVFWEVSEGEFPEFEGFQPIDAFICVTEALDGRILIGGTSSQGDNFVVEADSLGQIQDVHTYYFPGKWISKIVPREDSSYSVIARNRTNLFPSNYVARLSAEFELLHIDTIQAIDSMWVIVLEVDAQGNTITGGRNTETARLINFAPDGSTNWDISPFPSNSAKRSIFNDVLLTDNDELFFAATIINANGLYEPQFGFIDDQGMISPLSVNIPLADTIDVRSGQLHELPQDHYATLLSVNENDTLRYAYLIFDINGAVQDFYFLDIPLNVTILRSTPLAAGGFAGVGAIDSPGSSFQSAYVFKMDPAGNIYPNRISGTVYFDENENCELGNTETRLIDWLVTATSENRTFSTYASFGEYSFKVDTGEFTIKTYPVSNVWELCEEEEVLTFDGIQMEETVNMGAQANSLCPVLDVSLSTPFIRRCFENQYAVTVCNNGTVPAQNTTVDIYLDPDLFYISSSQSPVLINGDSLRFSLGGFGIGFCQSFSFVVEANCNAPLGATHCVEAFAFSNSDCLPADPLWDESDISITGNCTGSAVNMTIRNDGIGDMDEARDYVVYFDDLVYEEGQFQLSSEAELNFSFPADGSTWRLEADQDDNFPGLDQPMAYLEGCTTGEIYSTGFIEQFPQNDAEPFIDIDCQANIGSFDPNDKQPSPMGYQADHFIEANTPIEYKIRFQNTGTDTAFLVVLLDTLSSFLDPTSLRGESSSHPYTRQILEGNILRVVYRDIMLPDSNVNEPASHGFFKFKIDQQADLSIGTIIENEAAIYFDFNEPIITNTTFHEIGEDFLTTSIETVESEVEDLEVRIMPNPFRRQTRIEVLSDRYRDLEFWVYDALGKRVDFKQFTGNQLDYQQNHLPEGVYVYEIRSNGQRLQSGKLVVQ